MFCFEGRDNGSRAVQTGDGACVRVWSPNDVTQAAVALPERTEHRVLAEEKQG